MPDQDGEFVQNYITNFMRKKAKIRCPIDSPSFRPHRTTITRVFAQERNARPLLRIVTNGISGIALPDTGVDPNVMTREHAKSLGLDIDETPEPYQFRNAVGTSFESVGVTELDLSFPWDLSRAWKCTFVILEKCSEPMVIGKAFLDKFEVFTKLRHRLTKATIKLTKNLNGEWKRSWRLMRMDSANQKMSCFVDGQPALAIADSGADIDLVSLDYARMRKWRITPLSPDEEYITLANCDELKLTGYVETNMTIQDTYTTKRFYVLDGLNSDVLLGIGTIEDFHVFELKDVFVDIDGHGVNEGFLGIHWSPRYHPAEKAVDDLLGGQVGLQQREPTSIGRKMRNHLLFFSKTSKPSPEDFEAALKRRLNYLDMINLGHEDPDGHQQGKLSGNALLVAERDKQKRRQEYEQLRIKIISEIEGLGTPSNPA
ncbi:hypothetical protein PG990_008172 [Apiospora arundinis]|uniref:Peptidase A2 domain-containing protein n=1 Tax=Apiospora arundinis TaxID=335852 RepID=A0ABR2JMI0_9PEZI